MSGFDVAVVGYLSLDEIVCPSGHFADVPGGAAAYAAVAAARAGARVLLVARAGADYPADALTALADAGVALDELAIDDGPSRRSRMQDPTGRARVLPHHDEGAWWEATRRLAPPAPRSAARIHLFTAMPAAVLAAQLDAVPAGVRTLADTSTGYASREGAALLALLGRLHGFAPSREETRLLLPDLDDEAALDALGRRVPLAIQKRGIEGAVLRAGGLRLAEPSRAVEAVDTTGAGDSLVGGVAAGLSQDLPVDRLLDLGTRMAARSVTGVGLAGLLARTGERVTSMLQ